jgi:hypothetical protein
VNIANKVNMIGIPLLQAYKELGYRNPEALLEQMKKELQDPDLMILRSKMWQLSGGLQEANQQATMAQGVQTGGLGPEAGAPPGQPPTNESTPTLVPQQNSGTAKPMTAKGGTTVFSSARGMIDKTRQNMSAAGR